MGVDEAGQHDLLARAQHLVGAVAGLELRVRPHIHYHPVALEDRAVRDDVSLRPALDPGHHVLAANQRRRHGLLSFTGCGTARLARWETPRRSGSTAVAAPDSHLLASADGTELSPERLVDLLERGNGTGTPITAQGARAAVVGGIGGTGELAAWLFVFLLGNGVAGEVVEQDLAPRIAVVLDVTGETLQVVEATPGLAVHLHQSDVAGGRGERGQLLALSHKLSPAALLPGRAEDDLPEERLIRRSQPVPAEGGRARPGEQLAHLGEIIVELGRLRHPLVQPVELVVRGEGRRDEPRAQDGRSAPRASGAERAHRSLLDGRRHARR